MVFEECVGSVGAGSQEYELDLMSKFSLNWRIFLLCNDTHVQYNPCSFYYKLSVKYANDKLGTLGIVL